MSDLRPRIEALTRLNANLLALLRDVDCLSEQVRSAEASALLRRSAATHAARKDLARKDLASEPRLSGTARRKRPPAEASSTL